MQTAMNSTNQIENAKIVVDNAFLEKRPLSYSSLKNFAKSPKDYVWYISQPPEPPSDVQILGKAIETFIFDKENFNKLFHVYGDINNRTNEGKAIWAKLCADASVSKKTLINETDCQKAKDCAKAVVDNYMIKPYLDKITRKQIKITWTEKKYNLPMIGYVDLEGEQGVFIGEFKTTRDASEQGWPKQCFEYSYHLQVGIYRRGYHKYFYKFPNVFFILSETNEPYKSNIFLCDDKYMEVCLDELDYLLVSFRYCMDNDLFHQGYEFWLQSMPYAMMKFPGYAKLRSKI